MPTIPPNLLIQMSGAPGSGKSTMARLLGHSSTGVVIDHDILRSRFLEANIPFSQAAKHAYKLQWTLAEDLMKQSLSIIIDSTCNFEEVLNKGSALAKQYGYTYWYVECQVQDIDQLDQRLRARDPMPSQRRGVERPPIGARGPEASEDSRTVVKRWIDSPCRPEENAIFVNSTGNQEMLRDYILKQIFD